MIDTVGKRISITFSGGLSLGLVFFWAMLGWNSGPHVFGTEVVTGSLYPIAIQTAIAAVLVAVAFWRRSPADKPPKKKALPGKGVVVPMVLGILCAYGSVFSTAWQPIAGGVLLGAAQGLLLATWLEVYRTDLLRMLLMLFGASSLAYAASLMVADATGIGVLALSLILPVLAVLIMGWFRGPALQEGQAVVSRGGNGGSPVKNPLLGGAFVLCCFASGIVSFNAPVGLGSGVPLMAASSLACLALLVLVGLPQLEIPFALLSLVICVLMGCALVFDQAPATLINCMYAGYWILFLSALGWFARAPMTYRFALRGWAAVYFVTMVANLLALVIPQNIGCAIALVLMAAIFVAAFIKTSLAHRPQAPAASVPSIISDQGIPDPLDALARNVGLTETEREVFVLLAKGFPLKPIATQLHISESTAKYHRHNIYQKLGISSREELIALVHEAE